MDKQTDGERGGRWRKREERGNSYLCRDFPASSKRLFESHVPSEQGVDEGARAVALALLPRGKLGRRVEGGETG